MCVWGKSKPKQNTFTRFKKTHYAHYFLPKYAFFLSFTSNHIHNTRTHFTTKSHTHTRHMPPFFTHTQTHKNTTQRIPILLFSTRTHTYNTQHSTHIFFRLNQILLLIFSLVAPETLLLVMIVSFCELVQRLHLCLCPWSWSWWHHHLFRLPVCASV
jgi:hypothetical protein